MARGPRLACLFGNCYARGKAFTDGRLVARLDGHVRREDKVDAAVQGLGHRAAGLGRESPVNKVTK